MQNYVITHVDVRECDDCKELTEFSVTIKTSMLLGNELSPFPYNAIARILANTLKDHVNNCSEDEIAGMLYVGFPNC